MARSISSIRSTAPSPTITTSSGPPRARCSALFHAFSTRAELTVLFALGITCHLWLLVGYRARLFAVLSFLFVTSRDARIPLIENGGYVVLNLACMWACFVPLGQRFSVDAWRASWRATKELTLDDLNARLRPDAASAMTRSLAGLAVVMNLAVLYLFNVVNKTGYIWREGKTVHYVEKKICVLGLNITNKVFVEES